jgi:chemosensory pili system protein ChpA (sensor histidine kinase/response regulator)
METTIERMRDQLRRLDSETQGRMLSRQQAEAERLGYEEFDPLEMDRHSQLQQLSPRCSNRPPTCWTSRKPSSVATRTPTPVAATGADQHRVAGRPDAHAHGAVRTHGAALKRIVRQVAGELGKDVEFIVGNAEGEMDRNVLERMAAPLEHMLRNAVDHGLESRDARLLAGKPEQGRITLTHEGGDIVIEMRDDGAGVPLDAVRRKAIKRGLLAPRR